MTTLVPDPSATLTAFIDESERDLTHYFLGGLVCTPAQATYITFQIEAMMREFHEAFPGLDPVAELHGYEIMNRKKAWKRVPLRMGIAIFTRTMEIVSESGACFHVEGIHRERHANMHYKEPFPPREIAFTYLLEKINTCARTKATRVQVVADEHHTHATSQSNFERYQHYGTWGYRRSRLQNINRPMAFIDSRTSRVLQAADLATYLYNRQRTMQETDERATVAKTRMRDALHPAILRGTHRIWP